MNNRIFFRDIFFTAILFTLAQPPFSFYGISFIFLFFILGLIYNGKLENMSYKYTFLNGWFLGFFISVFTLFWIYKVTFIGVLPLFMVEAVFYGAIFVLFKLFSVKNKLYNLILFVILWNIMDFLRSKTVFAFPWNPIGEMVYYFISFIQIADIGGIWLVGIILSIFNILFFLILFHKKFRFLNVIIFVLLFIIVVGYGEWRLSNIKLKKTDFKIALIQGNIEQDLKWNSKLYLKNLNKYIEMSEYAAKNGVKLIIWPETAATCYLRYNSVFLGRISDFAKKNKVVLITGSLEYKDRKNYNSAFGIDSLGRIFYTYNKIKLVPFGERIPFSDKYPILNKIDFGQGDFWYGNNYTMATFEGLKFPTFICYEIIFPDFVRKFVSLGADFLVNLTNDAWFGRYSAPQQHAYLVPFRAVENRIGIARVANTGISFFVNPFGVIYNSSDIFEDKILIDRVFIKSCNTVYERYGDFYIYFLMVIIVLIKIVDIFYRRR